MMNNEQGKIYFGLGLDNNQLRSEAEQSKNIIRGIGDSTVNEGARIDNSYRKIAGAFAAVFTVQQATAFAKSIIQVRGEIESLEISFETLLGNKQKADALFSQIRTYAVNTPMQLNDLAKGAQMLLSFNVEAEKVMPTLKQIGDISMGDAQKFNSLTLAFSQMMSTGKLMGQDLLQMINAGFNPLSVISEKTGKSIGQLKKDMEAGAISSEMVADAFAAATAEGGKFYGMLEKQSKGINGSISNLKGAIDDMLNNIGSKNQKFIIDSINAATTFVKNYEEVGEVLAAIIATYGTYKAALMTTEAVRRSAATIKHTTEAEELLKLLTVEQQAKISKLGLSKTSAEYSAAVKAEIAANVQVAQSTLTKARADVVAANQAVVARRAEYVAAKQLEQQRLAELMHIGATGTAKQTEAAQRKLAAAETQRESAAIAFQSATRDFNAKKTAVETAARTANTTTTAVNTAAQTANATATGFLTVAKTRLAAVAARLNAVIMANPYALAATAAAALGYGLYKLVTYQTDAEKAQKRVNEATEEFEKSSTSEIAVLNIMFSRLNKAKEGTDEYRTAKEAIQKKYGDYLSKMGDEVRLLKDTTLAQKDLTTAILETARARAQEKFIQQESDAASEKQVAALRQIREKLIKEKGEDVGEAIYGQIKSMLVAYQNDPQDRDGKKYTEYIKLLRENGLGSDIGYGRLFTSAYGEYINSVQEFLKAQQDAEAHFGAPQSNKENQTVFDAATASLQQLMDRLPKAQEELAALKKAETPDPAAIAAKEQEIEQIKAKTLARERELSAIKDVKAQIEALQKEQLNYGKDDEEYKSREVRIKYLQTKLPETDGQQSKAETEAARIKRETAERIRKIQEYDESVKKQVAQSELDITQAKIDAQEEGFEKEMAQIDMTYKRLIFANQQREAQMVEALRDARALQWENDNPTAKAKGETFDRSTVTAADLSPKEKAQIEGYTEVANDFKEKAEADLLKKLLDQYRTYEQQRTEIARKFDEDRAAIEKSHVSQSDKEAALSVLEKRRKEAIKAVNDEEVESMRKSSDLLVKLFADASQKSVKELRNIINTTEELLTYLEQTDSTDIAPKFGFSAEELKTLKESPEKLKALREALKGLNSELGSRSPFEKFANDIDKAIDKIKAGDIGGGLEGIGSSIQAIMPTVKQFGDDLGTIFGDSQIGEDIWILTDLLGGIGKGVQGIGQIASGDIFGGITSVVSGVASIFSMANAAAERHKKALDELHRSTIEYYREYNALLHDAAMESSDSLFGERRLLDAKKFYAEAQKQQDLLNAKMGDLASGRVVTGHKKTGLFGWGKGKDVYSSLLSIYPDLIDQNGKFDASVAESILNTQKLDNNTTQMLSNLIQYSEQAEEAMNALNDIAGEIVGNMASTMTDAIFNAIETGADGWDAFQDSGADAIKALGKMMVQELIISNYLDKYSDDIAEMLGRGDKEGVMDLFGKIATEMPGIYGMAAEATQQIYDAAAKAGYDMTSDAERQASQKSGITASQESVNESNGRLTAIQDHTFDIREAVNAIAANKTQDLIDIRQAVNTIAASKTQDLMKIEINTERLHTIDANVFGIREASNLLVANSARMLQHLAGIEDNTSRLHAMDDNLSNMRNEMRTELSSVRHTVSDMALKGLKLRKS